MITEILSTSPDYTFQLGEKIGKQLKGDEILLLSGDLGAGKTLMTKGIAKALGIDSGEVVSPTFTLMNRFQGKFSFYHVDLYRLGEQGEGSLGSLPEVDDYIGDGVVIIEWAQYLDVSYFQTAKVVDIRFHVTAEDHRTMQIKTSLEYLKV
jgi:tRNA threonylcarbamoyladenosine biosynthesis protein TsaE